MKQNNDKNTTNKSGNAMKADLDTKTTTNGKKGTPTAADKKGQQEETADAARTKMNAEKDQADRKKSK